MKNLLYTFEQTREPHCAYLLGVIYKKGILNVVSPQPQKAHGWIKLALHLSKDAQSTLYYERKLKKLGSLSDDKWFSSLCSKYTV